MWLGTQLRRTWVSSGISEVLYWPDATTASGDEYRKIKHMLISVGFEGLILLRIKCNL